MAQGFESRKKKHKDDLFVRTYLFLLATLLLATGMFIFGSTNATEYMLGIFTIAIISVIGLYLFCIAIFTKADQANLVAEKTGNHEILILLIIAAGIVSAGIRRLTSVR